MAKLNTYVVEIHTGGLTVHKGAFPGVRDFLSCEMYLCRQVTAESKGAAETMALVALAREVNSHSAETVKVLS